jgi:hypothetical protein
MPKIAPRMKCFGENGLSFHRATSSRIGINGTRTKKYRGICQTKNSIAENMQYAPAPYIALPDSLPIFPKFIFIKYQRLRRYKNVPKRV